MGQIVYNPDKIIGKDTAVYACSGGCGANSCILIVNHGFASYLQPTGNCPRDKEFFTRWRDITKQAKEDMIVEFE